MRGEDGPYKMPDGNTFYVNWTTTKHTAAPVPVSATGPLSHWFVGMHDNTFIYDAMYSALFGVDDFSSLMLPADIDGDGIPDHDLVCPLQGNISRPANPLDLHYDSYSFSLGDK
jgi:hypothetical protein